MDLGDYTMVKERGMKNDEGGTKIARGMKIVRGLNTSKSDL